jgi:tetratricopeptide (TPR) repeat protein
MKKENLTNIQLHSAGATVQHKSPFESLDSYVNENEISQAFREEWVIPFYFELNNQSDAWVEKMIELKPQINENIILQNLGDFDWRTRSTGSYFAGIKKSLHLEKIIGIHLLKSEVCYAGSEYALTLASFNTVHSVYYLNLYLEYYLTKPELYFDQGSVITALKYLDEINNTNHTDKHLKNWEDLISWRNEKQIINLKNLKEMISDKSEEIEKQIQEIKPMNTNIDITDFYKSVESLKRIVNG